MPRQRRGPRAQQEEEGADGDADAASTGGGGGVLTPEQRTVEFFRRSMRSDSHWRPSMAMAKCLGIAQTKLLLTSSKDDTTNLVWTTVLVLIYCTTQLADVHELWYEIADNATGWLYQQPHFVENRDDLVHSACALLSVSDVSSLLQTVFPEPKDPETLALEAALGDWKICYLDEPPYSMYYWNETTNLSTWRNPLETAQQEKERQEKKKQRDELLKKVLAMRVRINRDTVPPRRTKFCDRCSSDKAQDKATRREAVVYCELCDGIFFCDDCCDRAHCTKDTLDHIDKGFRYRACVGIKGFPQESVRRPPTS